MKVGVGVRRGVGWLLVAGEPPQATSRQTMREQQKTMASFLANGIRWESEGLALARENREYHIRSPPEVRKRNRCAFS
jgi:hypothetical protein